jgi:hypothetical protein
MLGTTIGLAALMYRKSKAAVKTGAVVNIERVEQEDMMLRYLKELRFDPAYSLLSLRLEVQAISLKYNPRFLLCVL